MPPALLSASKTMPDGKAPSPMTATLWRSARPMSSSPTFRPSAGETRAAGVARHEQIVIAFVRIGVAHQAALGADGAERLESAGDQLVRINLMAGVPDQAVLGEIESQVQGEAQLDDAEVAGEVGGADAQDADQLVADFLSELRSSSASVSLWRSAGPLSFGRSCVIGASHPM